MKNTNPPPKHRPAAHSAGEPLSGIIDVTRRGVGYFPHEQHEEDIEIAPENLNTALNGDEVEVEVTGKRRGRVQGRVLRVTTRAKEQFVGTLTTTESGALVLRADDVRFYPTLRINPDPAGGAAVGDKVIVRIERWVNAHTDPIGSVVERIGRAGEHDTEMRATVLSRGMRIDFPEAVVREAEALSSDDIAREVARGTRRDFRDATTFTIDPEDAKDFDDALSVRTLDGGLVEVGIHIADVSHYVRPQSALDSEARTRGTSIYLVDRTIPMLPEELSNDLCSLKPSVDRLVFSAVFTLDKDAHIVEQWFGKSVIHSNKRFTYQSAQQILDAGEGEYHHELSTLLSLGHKLRSTRMKRGALEFETDEVRFELAEDGTPVRAYVKERLETMKMIEDWMLLANQEVARFVADKVKGKTPLEQTFIYRVHDTPKSDRLEELRIFLKAIGHDFDKASHQIASKDLGDLLKKIKGTPEAGIVQIATLRSMAKAIYSHKNIGHFSLSFSHYTHFTSPIRRYADVMVHRILESHLTGEKLSPEELLHYQKTALYVSEREVAAVEAERDSIKYKQVEYMRAHVGEEFDATVTGVTENGLYVAEKETRAEGMIHISNLKDDYYHFVPKQFALHGNKLKRTFRLGDTLRVKLASVDLEQRRIDWLLA